MLLNNVFSPISANLLAIGIVVFQYWPLRICYSTRQTELNRPLHVINKVCRGERAAGHLYH